MTRHLGVPNHVPRGNLPTEKPIQLSKLVGREDDLGVKRVEALEIVVDRRHGFDALLDRHLCVVAVPPTDVRLARPGESAANCPLGGPSHQWIRLASRKFPSSREASSFECP